MTKMTRDMETKTLAQIAGVTHFQLRSTARSMGLGLKYHPETHSYTIGRRSECIQIVEHFTTR